MPEVFVHPDPSLWSIVPDIDRTPEPQIAAWFDSFVDAAPPEGRSAASSAATLALRERAGSGPSIVLLLAASGHAVLASLSIYAFDDVPPPADRAQAERVAGPLLQSEWALEALEIEVGHIGGWRFTALLGAADARGAAVAEAVATAYVLGCRGRLLVAVLPPLNPPTAAAAHVHTERVLSAVDVQVEDADV
ncbi:hypothetical protein [Microbacterium oleivorans]|uniref:hypothetical protein n=1 Tax=Microbacterium oleivorans TaxID=273677 RepID=UPI00080DC5DD|nr:hypothetical protein [Microbacterium oleivorans]